MMEKGKCNKQPARMVGKDYTEDLLQKRRKRIGESREEDWRSSKGANTRTLANIGPDIWIAQIRHNVFLPTYYYVNIYIYTYKYKKK